MSNISSSNPEGPDISYLPNLFMSSECHPAFRARRQRPHSRGQTRRALSMTTAYLLATPTARQHPSSQLFFTKLDAPAIQVDRRALWREPSLQRKRAAFEHSI
jgi:hypothetical protein